jgi:hypothetical protein
MVFDPDDPDYLMVGCDGGIYESWDLGETWRFIDNLPVTQFYRVGVDNDLPFYNVYGGTQDNNSQGGPSRTTNVHGIRNSDWINTVGGDGYQTRIDPDDPNIVYSMWQYGGLIRYDRRNGEVLDIQPQPDEGEPPLIWNWDSPLMISPHSGTRLYFAANRLFRSDDRGDTWVAVSPDLTRGIDRNQLPVMGRVWSVDTVWKNVFTSFYGNIVALDESPLVEGLIYVGTDDGLVQVTEDGGENWREIGSFPGIPERTYVADLTASQHDKDTVYAVFNNHKSGNFEPYILESTDRGRSWGSVAGDLPDRHVVWSIVEDHVQPGLLFAGTELGLFFTLDGGRQWVELEGGMPTIAIRDLEIQQRENDLVAASFGRGFLILDDYTPLRQITPEVLDQEAALFPVKKTWMYLQSRPLGWGEKADQGHGFFTAPNPPFGAVFTYYLRDDLETLKEQRKKTEQEIQEKGGDTPYPSWEALRAEDREEKPAVILTVTDEDGQVVARVEGPVTAGIHRVAWNLRYPSPEPVKLTGDPDDDVPGGPPVVPGAYTVRLAKRVDGKLIPLGEPQTFETVPLGIATLAAADREELLAFQQKAGRLQRAVLGANEVARETAVELQHLEKAIMETPEADPALLEEARALELRLADIQTELTGDRTISRRSEPTVPSIVRRVNRSVEAHWSSTSAATKTHQRNYEIAATAFETVLADLRQLVEVDLRRLEEELEAAGAPWTPGRGLPDWEPE